MMRMKAVLIASLLVFLTFIGGAAYAKYDEAPRISAVEAYKLFKSGDAIFIDANPPASYNKMHLLGSVNIPNDGPQDLETVRNTEYPIPKDMKLVTYCL